MAATQKVSVAMGLSELRFAKTVAEQEGVSLSAFITRAVRDRLDERERLEAERQILAGFLPHEIPTADEQRALVAFWGRQGPLPALPRTRKPTRRK